jgi:hypothetical protein
MGSSLRKKPTGKTNTIRTVNDSENAKVALVRSQWQSAREMCTCFEDIQPNCMLNFTQRFNFLLF